MAGDPTDNRTEVSLKVQAAMKRWEGLKRITKEKTTKRITTGLAGAVRKAYEDVVSLREKGVPWQDITAILFDADIGIKSANPPSYRETRKTYERERIRRQREEAKAARREAGTNEKTGEVVQSSAEPAVQKATAPEPPAIAPMPVPTKKRNSLRPDSNRLVQRIGVINVEPSPVYEEQVPKPDDGRRKWGITDDWDYWGKRRQNCVLYGPPARWDGQCKPNRKRFGERVLEQDPPGYVPPDEEEGEIP